MTVRTSIRADAPWGTSYNTVRKALTYQDGPTQRVDRRLNNASPPGADATTLPALPLASTVVRTESGASSRTAWAARMLGAGAWGLHQAMQLFLSRLVR